MLVGQSGQHIHYAHPPVDMDSESDRDLARSQHQNMVVNNVLETISTGLSVTARLTAKVRKCYKDTLFSEFF